MKVMPENVLKVVLKDIILTKNLVCVENVMTNVLTVSVPKLLNVKNVLLV